MPYFVVISEARWKGPPRRDGAGTMYVKKTAIFRTLSHPRRTNKNNSHPSVPINRSQRVLSGCGLECVVASIGKKILRHGLFTID